MEWQPAHRLQQPLNNVGTGTGTFLLCTLSAAVSGFTLLCGCLLGVLWQHRLEGARHRRQARAAAGEQGTEPNLLHLDPDEDNETGEQDTLPGLEHPEAEAQAIGAWERLVRRALRHLARRRRISLAFASLRDTATLMEAPGSRPSACL